MWGAWRSVAGRGVQSANRVDLIGENRSLNPDWSITIHRQGPPCLPVMTSVNQTSLTLHQNPIHLTIIITMSSVSVEVSVLRVLGITLS